ncbi:MAG: class I SAM-dependent methyltransferase [Deltaproteobacteria bacterium]|nr:class I SAM-dependent methyltransferase [Deltaproteobacteria bacterium]
MKLRTLLSLIGSGRLPVLLPMMRLVQSYHRLAFLAAGLASGILRRLAGGKHTLDELTAALNADPSMRDGLAAWLQVGTALGELRCEADGYSLHGKLARQLADPANEAAAAFVEEVAFLHNLIITQTPQRLGPARPFSLNDQDDRMIAQSSRLAEPFICEAIDQVVPRVGALRLFEIGCGTAAYIRYAASRNHELTALGLDLQPGAAALATQNVKSWNLAARVTIETGNVLQRDPQPTFDVATLHQNIYYFPLERRVDVLRHVGGFLKPGGRLLLTTFCQGGGVGGEVLNLWGAMTEGCGRLPTAEEMVAQMQQAGFVDVRSRSLIPGEGFYSFVGVL